MQIIRIKKYFTLNNIYFIYSHISFKSYPLRRTTTFQLTSSKKHRILEKSLIFKFMYNVHIICFLFEIYRVVQKKVYDVI